MATKKYLNEVGTQHLIDKIDAKYAPLDSPALIGVPTAPTAPEGTKTTQIATTEFVADAIKTITSAYVYRGTVLNVAALPTVADEAIGNVYNITEKSETTADFVEGAGHVVDAGANVAVAEVTVGVEYDEVTPEGTENPSEEGWYEYNSGDDEYFLSLDVTVDGSKTYYEAVDVTANKWDILGGWFDVSELQAEIDKRLEFGTTMPTGTIEEPLADGRTFLYLGETTYEYNPVLGITAATNPAALGYYEETTTDVYAVTADTEPETVYKAWTDSTDTLFTKSATPSVGDTVYNITDGNVTAAGPIDSVGTDDIVFRGVTYTRADASDEYIDEKTYYTRQEEYLQGVIYVYSTATSSWVPKNSGDTFVEITNAEIDTMFD